MTRLRLTGQRAAGAWRLPGRRELVIVLRACFVLPVIVLAGITIVLGALVGMCLEGKA